MALLAGAAVTLVVAWASALWGPRVWLDPRTYNVEGHTDWPVPVPAGWRPPEYRLSGRTALSTLRFWRQADSPLLNNWVEVHEYGWPMRAARRTLVYENNGKLLLDTSIEPPAWLGSTAGRSKVPSAFVPLGFAINTILAAVMVIGVAEGVGVVRRQVRRRRGRCACCGYDRGGIANETACPECGRAAR